MQMPLDLKNMRVGIDGRPLIGKRAGVGNYVFNLCKELRVIMPDTDFFIYSPVPLEMPVLFKRWKLRFDPFGLARKMKPILWLKTRCGSLCKKDRLDVFWGTASFLPNLPSYIKTMVTAYDLNFRHVPETMRFTHLWAHRLFFEKDICSADKLLAISKGTSNSLYHFYGRAADAVITPGVNASFYPRTPKEIENCLGIYGIKKPYILSVATWEPRKNIKLLVRTFMYMKKKGMLSKHKLVLAGGRGWKNKRLHRLFKNRPPSDIIPLGYVPDKYLPSLYSGAEVFVFPSTHEGFGIPVLEARACGTKIVSTDIPELREAGEGDAIYVQPSLEGIRDGLLLALVNTYKKTAECNLPTWADGAKIIAELLNSF